MPGDSTYQRHRMQFTTCERSNTTFSVSSCFVYGIRFSKLLQCLLRHTVIQDWKKEHAFNYVKAPGGRLKTQQAGEAQQIMWQLRNTCIDSHRQTLDVLYLDKLKQT